MDGVEATEQISNQMVQLSQIKSAFVENNIIRFEYIELNFK